MVRGALAKTRRTDDEAATEPLHSLLAGMTDAEPTWPLARSKKPRVSFHSVTSATFVKDGDDPFRLSSPHERQLSPLSPAVPALSNKEEDTSESHYPHDSTPESTGRRDSMVGELEMWQQLATTQSAMATGSSLNTPERRGGLASPCGTPGEKTGEVTVEVPDLGGLIVDDEMASSSREVSGEVQSLLGLVDQDEFHDASEEVTGEARDVSGLVAEDEMGLGVQDEVDPCTRNSLVPATTTRLPTLSPAPAEWNLFQKYKQDRSDNETDDDAKSVASSVVAADRSDMPHEESSAVSKDAEISSACAEQEELARVSHASSHKEDTFDFAAVNHEFDSRAGICSHSSPPRAQTIVQGTRKPYLVGGSHGQRAPGLGLIAAIGGRSPLAERRAGAGATVRSPASGKRSPASGNRGWKPLRSPKQNLGNPAQGPNASPEQGLSEAEQALSSQHPIQQLTGGHSSLFGTRTRMGWEEFVRHGKTQLPQYDDQASATRMDLSLLGAAPAAFSCRRSQALYEELRESRAQCLEHFINEVAEDTEIKQNEYSVAKQMWDRSLDVAPAANELMQLLPHTGSLDYDGFTTNMDEWSQHCKDQALQKWYVAKRRWLESDKQVTQQHTQDLRDEVQRLQETTRKCRELSGEVRNSSKHMDHMTDLHEIKHAYQEAQFEELRRTQEEPELIRRKLPSEWSALEEDQQKNTDLEQRIQELKQRVRCEEVKTKEARMAALQQQVRKGVLEKEFYAHTCIMQNATPYAVCLQLRGNIKLWVEKANGESPLFVRVSVQLPDAAKQVDPSMKIYPAFSRGLVACAWCRTLALVHGGSIEKQFGEVFSEAKESLEAAVPCADLHRFLRHFDVEVLRITDKLRAMRNLRKAVPEVEWFSAQFQSGPSGEEPSAELTVLLSVSRSHSVQADGVARALTTEAWAGKFDATQCIVKFNANLVAQPHLIWSQPTVESVLGRLDENIVKEAMERDASRDSLCEMLKTAVQAMR